MTINNNRAIPPNTISGHDSIFNAVNNPIVDQINAINIKYNIGNIFCFCLLKSVKNNIPEIINEPKLTILITSNAQPPVSKKVSIQNINIQE